MPRTNGKTVCLPIWTTKYSTRNPTMKAQILLSALAAIGTADSYVGSVNAAAQKYSAVCLHQYSACITTHEA